MNEVLHFDPCFDLPDMMLVVTEPVWTEPLFIHKQMGVLQMSDLG